MKLYPTDLAVVKRRSFKSWEEIIDAVKERRLAIQRVLEERRVWREIQNQAEESWE